MMTYNKLLLFSVFIEFSMFQRLIFNSLVINRSKIKSCYKSN